MPCTDHGYIHVFHPVKSLEHKRLERSYNTVIVVFQCFLIILFVFNLCRNNFRKTVVGTERIACHKDLFFLNECVHCIRPVQIRHKHKPKRPVSDRHLFLIPRGDPDEITVHDLFQEAQRTACGYDLHLRAVIKQPLHASRVIWLGMADDKIVDLVYIGHFLKFLQIFVTELRLCRLEKDGLVSRFHHIRVIGRSKLCVHDDVEYSQLVIDNACPIEIVSQFYTFHVCLLILLIFLEYLYTFIHFAPHLSDVCMFG